MFNKLEARVLSEYKRSRAAPSTFCTLIKHYFSFIKHYISTTWRVNRIVSAIISAPLSPEIFKFRPLLSNSRPEGVFAWNQPAENNRNWGNDDIMLFKDLIAWIKNLWRNAWVNVNPDPPPPTPGQGGDLTLTLF